LLDELGWGADYDRVADDSSAVRADGEYGFTPERGVVMHGGTVRVSGATLLALAHEELAGVDQLREAKRILRAALDAHLGEHPLHSRELLRRWRRQQV
jgi:DNA repair protein RecO (recombination protein O)